MQMIASAYGFARAAACTLALGVALNGLSSAPAAAFDPKVTDKSVVRVLIGPGGKVEYGGHGTGFVIDEDTIATNWHVAEPESYVKDKKPYKLFVINPFLKDWMPAEIVWASQELDLAIIRVKGLGLPPFEVSGRDPFEYPPKAHPVFVVGYPGVSDKTMIDAGKNIGDVMRQASVNRGVVGRTLNSSFRGKLRPIIQHDASINQGNSGGPLFDDCNRVVGVNTWNVGALLQIVKDERGNQVATGNLPFGSFYSSHTSNLIEAVRTVPALKSIRLRVSTDTCDASDGGTSPLLIVFSGVTLLVALGAVGLVLFRRREVVRVVESYSAWVQRKGVSPGAKRTDSAMVGTPQAPARPPAGPRRATNVEATARPASEPGTLAAATGDWVFSGTDGNKQKVSLAISKAELEKAMGQAEKGLVIGRSASMADKVLGDPSISRRHVKLAQSGDSLTIEDLKSAYGTKVNGQALEPFQPTLFGPGDTVVIGAVTLEVKRG